MNTNLLSKEATMGDLEHVVHRLFHDSTVALYSFRVPSLRKTFYEVRVNSQYAGKGESPYEAFCELKELMMEESGAAQQLFDKVDGFSKKKTEPVHWDNDAEHWDCD